MRIYWSAAALWAGAGLIIGLAAAIGYNQTHPTTVAHFEEPPVIEATVAFPGAQQSWHGSGVWSVPAEAPPGSYSVATGGLTFGCTWELLKSLSGKPKDSIASGAFNRGGSDQFTIGSSAKWLRLRGDCIWEPSP